LFGKYAAHPGISVLCGLILDDFEEPHACQ
jgi:hypothetical protein